MRKGELFERTRADMESARRVFPHPQIKAQRSGFDLKEEEGRSRMQLLPRLAEAEWREFLLTRCTVTADGDVINANTGKVVAKAPLPPKPETLAESGSGGENDTPSAEESNTALEKTAGDGYNKGGPSFSIDIDAVRPQRKTEPGTAFFWSGKTDGMGGANIAANIARSRGGVTLESTIEDSKIMMPEWDFNNPSTMEAWELASQAYAEQVSGEIRAVIGSDLRTGNIWENNELPSLMRNPNVTKIITIDPKTQEETIVFER